MLQNPIKGELLIYHDYERAEVETPTSPGQPESLDITISANVPELGIVDLTPTIINSNFHKTVYNAVWDMIHDESGRYD
jgi:hypothetical protein